MNSLSVLLCSKDVPSGRPWIPSRGVFRCMQVSAAVLMISLGLVLYHFVGEAHGPKVSNHSIKTVSIEGNISFTSKAKPIAQFFCSKLDGFLYMDLRSHVVHQDLGLLML